MQKKKKKIYLNKIIVFILYFRKILYIEISNRKETRHRERESRSLYILRMSNNVK